jgi:hypothetical protein
MGVESRTQALARARRWVCCNRALTFTLRQPTALLIHPFIHPPNPTFGG